jgi:hypothetical protein
VEKQEQLATGATQERNDFRRIAIAPWRTARQRDLDAPA